MKIYNPKFVLKSDEKIKIEMLQLLMKEDIQRAEKVLDKLKKENNR